SPLVTLDRLIAPLAAAFAAVLAVVVDLRRALAGRQHDRLVVQDGGAVFAATGAHHAIAAVDDARMPHSSQIAPEQAKLPVREPRRSVDIAQRLFPNDPFSRKPEVRIARLVEES